MHAGWNLLRIKRGLLAFWAVWFSIVVASNITDGLKSLALLPERWAFVSGNYLLMARVTDIYGTPTWMVTVLFLGVVIWEGMGAFLFWRSAREFSGVEGQGLATVYIAFAVSLALWAAFVIADELFIAYRVGSLEAVHMGIFTAQLMTLLAVRLLPDD